MRLTYIIYLIALLNIKSQCAMPKEFFDDNNGQQIGQDEGSSNSDHMIQLKSMVKMMSVQISLLQNEDSVQKSEMQRIQRDSEQKERLLNNLADENQNLRQLLVKMMSATNQSEGESSLGKDSPPPGYRREFNQYMEGIGGVTYVRWGRTACEDPAYPLYTGYAASGSAYPTSTSGPGGTSDIVCLHPQPQYVDVLSQAYSSSLYGLEYDFDNLPFSTVNNGGANLRYNDIPCTVCHINSRSHQFMLPGRNTCPSGWVREYWGYLISSWSGRLKSSMICVDEAPEAVISGAGLDNAGLVNPVEAACTAIPCPPYRAGYELPCVVCSK